MATEDVFGIVGTTQAGNFHVEKAVAEGGFGVVYRAQHEGFRAPVALKCLKIPEEMTQRQRDIFLEKFREEGELLFRLSASIPEVVRPLHIDVLYLKDGGFVPFLAMEWLEGESLDGIITRRAQQGQAPLGLHKMLKMLRPVAHALSRAHRFLGPHGNESIVHRDLKPENIFIATIGGVESIKILDFGIAKARRLASEAAGRLTGQHVDEDEVSSFTPAYGSPEQWAPKRFGATGPWTDVWGLALTMVEVLAGGPAIDGDTYSMRRLAIDEKRRPTPRALGATVSDEVEMVFERALAVDPRKRTREMETFWTELERSMGVQPSFVLRDQRRDDDGVDSSPSRELLVPAAGGAGRSAPLVPQTPTPGAARLGRIELQRVERPAAQPNPPPPAVGSSQGARSLSERSGPPSSQNAPLSADFSDVFVPSEHAPRIAPVVEKAPSGPSNRGLAAPPRRMIDALEFDLDAPPSIRRPSPIAGSSGALAEPAERLVDATPSSARVGGGRGGLDLELSLPTESAPSSGPRSSGRGLAAERSRAPWASANNGDDSLEASLDLDPKSARRPAPRQEMEIPLEIAPKSVRRSSPGPRPEGGSGFDVASGAPPHARPGNLPAELGSKGNAELTQLGARIRGPLSVLLLALTISVGEIVFTRITGTPLMLGPIRPFWVAAPLALGGVAFTLWRFMGDRDDG